MTPFKQQYSSSETNQLGIIANQHMKYPIPKVIGSIQIKDEKPPKKVKAVDRNATLNVSKHICKFRCEIEKGDCEYFCKIHRRKESKCNTCAIEDPNGSVRIMGKHDVQCGK